MARRPSLTRQKFTVLAAALRGQVIRPDDPAYDEARRVWNGMIDKYPALIARCTGTADVVAAVQFARANGLLVAVRGGGHNVAGNAVNDGGLVIDLSPDERHPGRSGQAHGASPGRGQLGRSRSRDAALWAGHDRAARSR